MYPVFGTKEMIDPLSHYSILLSVLVSEAETNLFFMSERIGTKSSRRRGSFDRLSSLFEDSARHAKQGPLLLVVVAVKRHEQETRERLPPATHQIISSLITRGRTGSSSRGEQKEKIHSLSRKMSLNQ